MSKLYCIATSEKASKGQGGNDYITVDIKDEKQKTFFKLLILPSIIDDGIKQPPVVEIEYADYELLQGISDDINEISEKHLSGGYEKKKLPKDIKWYCINCDKVKEEYEASLCDKCFKDDKFFKEKGKSQKGENICKHKNICEIPTLSGLLHQCVNCGNQW